MVFPTVFELPEYGVPGVLRRLIDVHAPGGPVVHMTIGEPRPRPFPAWVADEIAARHWTGSGPLNPPNERTPELQTAHRRAGSQRRYRGQRFRPTGRFCR